MVYRTPPSTSPVSPRPPAIVAVPAGRPVLSNGQCTKLCTRATYLTLALMVIGAILILMPRAQFMAGSDASSPRKCLPGWRESDLVVRTEGSAGLTKSSWLPSFSASTELTRSAPCVAITAEEYKVQQDMELKKMEHEQKMFGMKTDRMKAMAQACPGGFTTQGESADCQTAESTKLTSNEDELCGSKDATRRDSVPGWDSSVVCCFAQYVIQVTGECANCVLLDYEQSVDICPPTGMWSRNELCALVRKLAPQYVQSHRVDIAPSLIDGSDCLPQ